MQVFDLEPTLDDKTREMLQIYQPLITQDTGLPVAATPPAPIVNTQDVIIEEKSNPTPSSEIISEGETNAVADEKRTINCLCVDDNDVNLKACLPAIQYICTILRTQ